MHSAISRCCTAWALLNLICATTVSAAKNDWAEGTSGRSTGATRDYYNAAGRLAWRNFMGDWHDARDTAQGDAPYAAATVEDDDTGKSIDWDVTELARQRQHGKHQNQGWMNVYHGGTTPSPSDQHLFIDNVVVARKYIGPMTRK